MTGNADSWMERLWSAALPGVVMGLFALVLIVPAPVPKALVPDFVLMMVFIAAACRSSAFPVWLAFGLGILADLLGGTPPGVQAAVFTGVHGFAYSQRRHLQVSYFLWGGFAIAACGATLFRWGVLSGFYETWLDPWPLLTNLLLTICLFPLVAAPFRWLVGGARDV